MEDVEEESVMDDHEQKGGERADEHHAATEGVRGDGVGATDDEE